MGWDESKHPRVQAGDSAGGQFTSAARKAAGVLRKRPSYTMIDLDEEEDYDYAVDQFDGFAAEYLNQAYYAIEDDGYPPPTLLVDDAGIPLAFYQADWYPMPVQEGDDFEWTPHSDNAFMLFYLGSAQPGGGTAALMECCREALLKKATMLVLEAAPQSIGFYERIGMKPVEGMFNHFWWSKYDMEAITKEYFSREVQR